MRPTRFHLLLLATALLAAALVLLATRHGVGLSPDSATYLLGARQLVRGHGLISPTGTPITHFPPLFPALLAAPGLLGVDAIPAARALNLLLVVANVWLIGAIAHRSAGNSISAGLAAAALAATAGGLLRVHAWAWSEPLFLFTGFLGLWLLQRHLWRPRRGLLLAAAALTAAAFLTRYAGAGLMLTAALGLLLAPGRPLRRRLGELALFLAIVLLPMAGWLVRNRLVADTATNRRAVYHPVTSKQLAQGARTIAGWIFPSPSDPLAAATVCLFALALAALAVFSFRARRAAGPASAARPPYLFGLFLPVHAGFLLVSLCWFDAQIPLDDRMLCPLLAAAACYGVPAAAAAFPSPRLRTPVFGTAGLLVLLGVLSWFLYQDYLWIHDCRRHGLGYASRDWRSSKVMAAVRNLPPGAVVYSNAPGAIMLLADRVAADVPEKVDRNSTLPKDDYEPRLQYMREQIAAGGSLAWFRAVRSRHNLPTEAELKRLMPLAQQTVAPDGTLYRWAGPATRP